jgi:SOS-response transcriptional repressor LexA
MSATLTRAILTARQLQVLRVISSFIAEHECPPTIREIGVAVGILSTNGVADHLRRLEIKGYLTRVRGQSRCVRLLRNEDGSEYAPLRLSTFDEIERAALALPDASLLRLCARLLNVRAARNLPEMTDRTLLAASGIRRKP